MIERLTYLISTCKGYEAPLNRLLGTLPWDAHAIVVSGGHEQRGAYYRNDTLHVEVTHTSYDYTALIEYLEGDWELSPYLFLLHDTMELGPDSDRLIRTADPAVHATAVWGGECNLALYWSEYLHSRAADILALKNCSKLEAVQAEGFLWRTCPEWRRGVYPGQIAHDAPAPSYGGSLRQRIYYSGVDLVKWKANWGQQWPPNVVTP